MPRRWIAVVSIVIGCTSAYAGTSCRTDIPASAGYKIRNVGFVTLWGIPDSVRARLKRGSTYSPDRVSELISQTRQAVSERINRDLREDGVVSSSYTDSCVTEVAAAECQAAVHSDRCVDVLIRPLAVRVDLVKLNSNYLPIVRTNRLSFAPRWARHDIPEPDFTHDQAEGIALGGSLSLRHLSATARNSVSLEAAGHKSVNRPYFDASGRLVFDRKRTGKLLESVGFAGGWGGSIQPLGQGAYQANLASGGFHLRIRPQSGPVRALTVVADAGHTNNALYSAAGPIHVGETVVNFRSATDARIGQTTTVRVAAAGGVHMPGGLSNYRRVAVMGGLYRELTVRPHQSFGLEILSGTGHTWGNAPPFNQFYSGNTNGNFLYRSLDDAVSSTNAGPLFRALGAGRGSSATGFGGTSYWHSNVTVAIPLPYLHRPLIPGEDIDDTTLPEVLKAASIPTAKSFIATNLQNAGMSPSEADKRADAIVEREIAPAIRFIANDANIFAVRPLFMLDVARLANAAARWEPVQVGVGGGVEMLLVVARLQIGYVANTRASTGVSSGQVIVRLVFTNVF